MLTGLLISEEMRQAIYHYLQTGDSRWMRDLGIDPEDIPNE